MSQIKALFKDSWESLVGNCDELLYLGGNEKEMAMRTGVTYSMKAQSNNIIATMKSKIKAVGHSIKDIGKWLVTTPAGWVAGAVVAVGGVIAVINNLAKAEKQESDAATKLYEKSKEKIQKNKEEAKTVDDLIEKYKELKSSSDIDSDTRNEIKEIQYDIVDLVGSEAKSLDLVNGKLDEQIAKLKEISSEKSKQNVEDARDAYDNAVYASDVMTGSADKYGNDVVVKWTGAEAKQIHQVEGFEKIKYNEFVSFVQNGGFEDIFRENKNKMLVNPKFVVDTTGIEGLDNKIARLKELKDFLAENELRSTELYQGVVSSIENYKTQLDNENEAANNLVNSTISD